MKTLTKAFFSIPFTYTLLFCTAAVALTTYMTFHKHLFFICSAYAILLMYALIKNNLQIIAIVCTMLLFSLCTITRINYYYNSFYADQTLLNKPIKLQGVIKNITHATLTKKQTTILLQVDSVFLKNKSLRSSKLITVFCPTTTVQHLQVNQIVHIKHILLSKPQQNSDYELYLIKEGIWATAHCSGNNIEIQKQLPLTIFQKTQLKLQEQIDTVSSLLFEPVFLGIKEKNHANLLQQHRSIYWGIAHHMARSGVHLAILFAFLMLILHYAHLPYLARYFLCSTILLGYACISQASISFIRALIMILLHIISKIFYKIPSTLHILTLTTLITLLHNPMQLFFLDFQLSFGITYIIIWLFTIKKEQTLVLNNKHLVRS